MSDRCVSAYVIEQAEAASSLLNCAGWTVVVNNCWLFCYFILLFCYFILLICIVVLCCCCVVFITLDLPKFGTGRAAKKPDRKLGSRSSKFVFQLLHEIRSDLLTSCCDAHNSHIVNKEIMMEFRICHSSVIRGKDTSYQPIKHAYA